LPVAVSGARCRHARTRKHGARRRKQRKILNNCIF
jgi:hypothetical protein